MLGARLTQRAFARSLSASGRAMRFVAGPVSDVVLASAFALQVVDDVLDGSSEDSPARAGWLATGAIGRIAETVAALPVSEERARAILRTVAQTIGSIAALQEANVRGRVELGERCVEWIARVAAGAPFEPALDFDSVPAPPLFASMRAEVAKPSSSVFFDWTRDAAAAYGDADAAQRTFAAMAALIEGIKIIDDIQDEEGQCVAVDLGVGRALNLALGALAYSLELTAALPLADASWRAATAAIGRGIRETAIGQDLETKSTGDFAMYWKIVDRKTSPLVATAFELGALAAGAAPADADALRALAIPFGRLLQVCDDCNDALGPEASDWRMPHLNLLMLYALAGPHASEMAVLLRNAADPETLRAAKVLLLRDGALAYAIHAQLSTIAAASETIQGLAIPNPAPFLTSLEQRRAEAELLLRKSGVDADLAASLTTA